MPTVKIIGVVTPHVMHFNKWKKEFAVSLADNVVMVIISCDDDIRGREFIAIIYGPMWWEVDGGVVHMAKMRLRNG